jgi:hypothetical protein
VQKYRLRHSLLALTLLAALAGCASSGDKDDGPTVLAITAWPTGRDGPVHHWTLRCPAGGTLPMPARACLALLALDHPLRTGTPGRTACAQIYGGPAVATVTGKARGRRVQTAFSRIDGCQIERWNAVDFLFPGVRSG